MPDGQEVDREWLAWLADAPLFVDDEQVRAIYDAVLRPAFETTELELSEEQAKGFEESFSAKANVGLPSWFPWLKAGVEAGAEVGANQSATKGKTITLRAVDNPTRQLVEIALHYVVNQPTRMWVEDAPSEWQPPSATQILASPRMLTALDFPPGTKFVPMAAELNDGQVVTFFDQLIDKFKQDGGSLPVHYPDDATTEQGQKDRDNYWQWLFEHWNANKAIQVIEDRVGVGGRPRWIDYRVPIGQDTLHLHVVGHGNVDTGVFAYNLVKRGWKHGVRLVGMLKSEPDINVLAVYEK